MFFIRPGCTPTITPGQYTPKSLRALYPGHLVYGGHVKCIQPYGMDSPWHGSHRSLGQKSQAKKFRVIAICGGLHSQSKGASHNLLPNNRTRRCVDKHVFSGHNYQRQCMQSASQAYISTPSHLYLPESIFISRWGTTTRNSLTLHVLDHTSIGKYLSLTLVGGARISWLIYNPQTRRQHR